MIEARKYENGDLSFSYIDNNDSYDLEIFLKPKNDGTPWYNLSEMIYTSHNIKDLKVKFKTDASIEGDKIVGYGFNEDDKIEFSDPDILSKVKFFLTGEEP